MAPRNDLPPDGLRRDGPPPRLAPPLRDGPRPSAVAAKAPGPRQQPDREIIKYSQQEIQQIRCAGRKGTIINQILCSLAENHIAANTV